MTDRLNARIDEALAAKLATLRRVTQRTTTEVVRDALEHYYRTVEAEPRAMQALEASGFIGCADADPELSTTYKSLLPGSLERKT